MRINDPSYSRPVAAANQLGELAPDSHRFMDKRVLLTGEPDVLATDNGRQCILASLRLLIRVCRNITVVLPQDKTQLLSECKAIAEQLAFGSAVNFPENSIYQADFDATLCVGKNARPDLAWTVINSGGWLARVSSGATSLQGECTPFNPVAALASACLGVAEVFKRLIALKPSRAQLQDNLIFSLYNYRTGEKDSGPELPTSLPLDLMIVGAGAIGNGVVYLLSTLPVTGRILIVDNQKYGEENLGTSILIGPKDIGKGKAILAAQSLDEVVLARGFTEELSTFTHRLGSEITYPKVALGCLHDIEARHELQNLWLDMTIDGAIGDFACQVSRHPWSLDVACLICLFRPQPNEHAEVVASQETGLSVPRSKQPFEIVTESDVSAAPKEKQEWLRNQIGRPICSVIHAAMAQALSDRQLRTGFQPSVPFVACLSASMVVGELLKYVVGWQSTLEPRFQMDILQGPAFGAFLPQERRQDCICVTRQKNIDLIRRKRQQFT